MWRNAVSDEVRLFQASPQVTGIGETPDIHHPSPEPNVENEEETKCLSWGQILRLLTWWDPLIQYTQWLHQSEAAMNVPPTAHKMLAMCLPVRNVLIDLSRILLAADTTIPSIYVETVNERYIALCNTIGTVPLTGMSYPLLAVLT